MKRSFFLKSLLSLTLSLAFGCSQGGGGGGLSGYPPVKNQKPGVGTVVTYGDSLTSGVNASKPYSEFLRTKLSNVMNTAVAGITSAEALANYQQLVLQFNPKLVILTIGGNDPRAVPAITKEQSIANLVKMIELAQAKGALVVYLGINPPVKQLFEELKDASDSDVEAAFGVSRFAAMVAAARNAGALAIDDCMDGIWLNENLKVDKLHPNAQGSEIISNRVLGALGTAYP